MDDERELVTAQSQERHRRGQRLPQALADVTQQSVAHAMAVRIVDGPEAVQAEDDEADAGRGRLAIERGAKALVEQSRVRQSGDRVVAGEVRVVEDDHEVLTLPSVSFTAFGGGGIGAHAPVGRAGIDSSPLQ